MKIFIVLSAILAVISAQALYERFDNVDESGNIHFGYNDGLTARNEIRTPKGIVRGSYIWIDGNNEIQKVVYTSDPVNGYQIVESSKTPFGERISTDSESKEKTSEIIERISKLDDKMKEIEKPEIIEIIPEEVTEKVPEEITKIPDIIEKTPEVVIIEKEPEVKEKIPEVFVRSLYETQKIPGLIILPGLPVPPEDTPEVKAARAQHLEYLRLVSLRQ